LLHTSGAGDVESYFRTVVKSYGDDFTGKAYALGMMADYYKVSDKKKALGYYNEEREAWSRASNLKEEGDVLCDIGLLSESEGDERKAGELFQRVLDYYRSKKEAVGEASMLQVIGGVYKEQGRRAEAIDYYEKSLSVYETAKRFYEAMNTLATIGKMYEEQG